MSHISIFLCGNGIKKRGFLNWEQWYTYNGSKVANVILKNSSLYLKVS